jgi:phosphoserine phosphatase RsbU/P
MSRTPRLIVIEPSGVRREVPITPTPFRIGRQAGTELTLRDSRISRQQAQILATNGSWVIEDMGSRHGTFVNGEKVMRHELQPKDRIDFGMADSYKLVFLGEGATIEELVERVEAPAPSQPGSRELYHLGVLLEVARTMGTGLSLEDVLTAVVDAAIQVTRTERGVLLLASSGGELQMMVARDAQRGTLRPDQLQVSQSVLKRVVNTRRELIVSDMGDNPGVGATESVARLELHTVVAIPIDKLPVIETLDATISARQSELMGVLYLDSHVPSSAFTELDREVLRTLAREAATVVENARLFAAARAKVRLDHEIEIASQIQRTLLPKALPNLPNLSVTGSTLSCHSVGGDCFDVIALGSGRFGFFVGDVSGKGISAALLATLLQGVFFTTAAMDIALAGIFERVNQYLCERSGEDRYATVFYGILDKSGKFEYVNAGHVPPLILRRKDGTLEGLGSANFPVGMFPEAEYESARANLEAGDFLVIYTDGVSEACNPRNELFEEARLRKIMEGFTGETVEDLANAIREGMRVFTEGAPQSDDITILSIQYKGNVA